MGVISYQVEDNLLHARIHGDGPPLILYPGLAGRYEDTLEFMGKLADEYTLITPDSRGLGESVCLAAEQHTWSQYARDVVELLNVLGLDRASIGGVSFGAGVSLAAALRHPERFNAVILLSPVHMGNRSGYTPEQQRWFDEIIVDGKTILKEGFATLLGRKDETTRITLCNKWAEHDPHSLGIFLSSLRDLGHPFDDPAELRYLDVPVLILPGADFLHPREVGVTYGTLAPRSRVMERPTANSGADIGDFIESGVRKFLRGIHEEAAR